MTAPSVDSFRPQTRVFRERFGSLALGYLNGIRVFGRNLLVQDQTCGRTKTFRRSMARAEALASVSCCFVKRRERASARAQADEEREVVGHDRGPHVGLEVVEPPPRAAGQAIRPLEA